jgi:hypothetical protein
VATCIVVPVNSANVASWKALLAVGFRLAARGEVEPDNPVDDRMHELLRLERPRLNARVPGRAASPMNDRSNTRMRHRPHLP